MAGIKKIVQHNYGWVFLPIYFILHGCAYYWQLLTLKDVGEAFLIVGAAVFFIWMISFLMLKTADKRSLFTLLGSFFLLFATPFMSAINAKSIMPLLQQQLLLFFLVLVLVVLLLRLIKKVNQLAIHLLNTILLLLVLISFLQLATNVFSFRKDQAATKRNQIFSKVSIKEKLPVYLIVLDEYAGRESLLKNFNYANDSFINYLGGKGFKIIKSASSNYNYTLLSIPSMLNGTYIKSEANESVYGKKGSREGLLTMYNNSTFKLFSDAGYTVKNYSPFFVEGFKPAYENRFLPSGALLLLYPTLIDDFAEQVPAYLLSIFKNADLIKWYYGNKSREHHELINTTLQTAEHEQQIIFCYLHLMLPHAPYLLDSMGNINTNYLATRSPTGAMQQEAYLQQLIYTNKLVQGLTDSLLRRTNNKAVIMIMSDHGYKSTNAGTADDKFNSFNAVYYPGSDSLKWYDGMSNVNQFRCLASMLSGQDVPLEKDSLVR